MFAYPPTVVDEAWEGVGGVDAWRSRLAERSREQHAIEVVFGPEWRDIRWPKRQKTWSPVRSICAYWDHMTFFKDLVPSPVHQPQPPSA